MGLGDAVADVVGNVVASVVMLILAILAFFITVFVVDTGAALAGVQDPQGGFVILSATILVASAVLSGMWKEA
ncbi:MAG: hypothetical protein SV186_01895 [Candidatus Nanohaloarchaea archaeon]|nr:hypothetical protein [Candidatus Nanohaloarchaea archaeon]